MADADPEYERFFHREFAAVKRTVFLICHDEQRAQDIAQDAFVEALRRWERLRGLDRPGAWVRRVAIRLAVRSVRRETRRRNAERSLLPDPAPAPRDPDVMDAVRSLPGQQRAAIVLFYYEDRGVDEIARLIGCSTSTARVHLHRARARLGVILQQGEEVRHRGD